MAKVTMSMSRLLARLKTINGQIESSIQHQSFIGYKANNTDKVGTFTAESLSTQIKSDYQSVVALIENKKRLEAAKVQSNAVTDVKIGDRTYKVADAIKRKTDIKYDKLLLQYMKVGYQNAVDKVTRENIAVQNDRLDRAISTNFSVSKEKIAPETLKAFTESFLQNNSWDYIDPLGVKKLIDDLEAEIMEFETEVDGALSEINAITMVEVDLVD